MNRFLITSLFTLALFVGATGAATSVHANAGDTNNSNIQLDADGNPTGNTTGVTADPFAKAAASKAAENTAVSQGNTTSDGFNSIMGTIATLFAWLLGVAALVLDWAVYYTIIDMGNYVKHLTGIGVTWRILRDIANIMLIFGFLGAGIATVLNIDQYGWKTKMLPKLLIAAVFLNFSLFFTEALIDVSNVFAVQFYTQINGGHMPTASTLKDSISSNEGIQGKIMSQLGLTAIYAPALNGTQVFKGSNPLLIGFMSIILFMVAAFVLFSLAFILIARFVALIFYILLSPVGFMGLAIPQMEYRAGQWWHGFLDQIITAPILMLLLYVALAVITDVQFLIPGGDPTGFTTSNFGAFASYLLSFMIAIGLLLVVVIKAKSMSAFGAGKATAFAGKLTFGATAWGMRSTAGAGSQAASQWLRRTKFGATKTGRLVTSFADKGAKASFDVRGATAFGGLKAIGVVAGDAAKDGYRGKRDATIKAHEEYNKSVRKAFDDRGATKEEEKKIVDAEAAQEVAQKAHTIASEEHKPKEELRNEHKAEVERLAEEMRRDPILGLNAEHTAKRDAAAQKLATSAADFAASLTKLNQATKDLEKAKDATKKETKESGDRISGEKKKASLAYAENITKSPMAWAVFGSGGNAAAKKIIKDAKHTESDDEKAIKAIKASIKKEADDAAKNAGGAGATPAPATPTPAPAPAADGH